MARVNLERLAAELERKARENGTTWQAENYWMAAARVRAEIASNQR